MKMPLIEVKKSADGTLLARRHDGRPLTAEDRREAKMLSEAGLFSGTQGPLNTPIADEVRKDGALQGVLIYSTLFEDSLWLVRDNSFIPTDGLAIYYPEELPLLKTKTPEELREIHRVKLAFPGCRVIQEGAEIQRSPATQGK